MSNIDKIRLNGLLPRDIRQAPKLFDPVVPAVMKFVEQNGLLT